MALTITSLFTPLTADQVEETLLTAIEMLALKPREWRKGGALRVILRAVATLYAGFTTIMAAFVKAGFLETATGDWLTLLARYVYGVTRAEATFATGPLRLVNTAGGIYGPFAPGEIRARNPTTKKLYSNLEEITLNPGDDFPFDFIAVERGSGSSSGPNEITEFETTLNGVTVTNEAAIIGSDEQSDDEVREACLGKIATNSARGPRLAYDYAIRNALRDDGSRVDINRVSISASSSIGKVTAYAASPSGTPTAGDLDDARDNVEELARPDSVTFELFGVTTVATSKSLTVWAKSTPGLDADALETLVEDALEAWISTYPIGGIRKPPATQGYLWASGIEGTAKGAHSSIFAVDGAGSDVALAAGEVATLTATIDVRIVVVN